MRRFAGSAATCLVRACIVTAHWFQLDEPERKRASPASRLAAAIRASGVPFGSAKWRANPSVSDPTQGLASNKMLSGEDDARGPPFATDRSLIPKNRLI